MTLRRLVAFSGLGLLALAPLGSTACRTATQIHVKISTSEGVCSAGGTASDDKRTGVFVGAAGSITRSAQSGAIEGCAAEMGSVTLVPSGKEGVPLVEVAMSLTKGDPATCRDRPGACIFARRRLGFQDHRALSLSIRLDSSCIGVPCGVDETCDNGSCRDANVTCAGEECALTPVADAGPPGTPSLDAGAGADGGDPDAATKKCPLAGHPVAHPAFQDVSAIAAGDSLFLAHDNGDLQAMDASGTVTVLPLPNPSTGELAVTAIAAAGDAVAVRRGSRADVVTRTQKADAFVQAGSPIAVMSPSTLAVGSATSVSFLPIGGAAGGVATGPTNRIASGHGAVVAVVTQQAGQSRLMLVTPAGKAAESALISSVVDVVAIGGATGTTGAVWFDGTSLWRSVRAGPSLDTTVLVASIGAKLAALAVAGDDVLWLQEGGSGIGAGSPPTMMALRLSTKDGPKPIHAVPAGAAAFPGVTIAPVGRCAYVRLADGIHAYPLPD
ncbi:MAG: hypothetical protein JNL38_41215 [Myxococcales bacterium]|nr:hypothetical protein [Myxococcales bacterium]